MTGMTLCPYLSHEHPIRFAHRGSMVLWPENTIMAFQGAVDLGYRYIETDAHVTRNGVIVLFHDDCLERVTNGTGLVKNWQWDDLQKLDAAYHFSPEAGFPFRAKGVGIPSLEEAVTTFPDVMFNIDLKQPYFRARPTFPPMIYCPQKLSNLSLINYTAMSCLLTGGYFKSNRWIVTKYPAVKYPVPGILAYLSSFCFPTGG